MWMLSQSVNYAVVAEGSAEWRQWVTLKRNHLQDFGKVLEEVAWRLSFSQARALPGLSCLVALTTRVFPARLWCPGSLRWFALLQVALSDGAQQRMLSVVWVTNPKGIYSCVWSWSRREFAQSSENAQNREDGRCSKCARCGILWFLGHLQLAALDSWMFQKSSWLFCFSE